MNKDKLDNLLYIGHALIVWIGGSFQIHHVFSTRSAEDVTLVWAVCLLVSELIALPRCVHSPFWVWRWCHIIGAILTAILLGGVITYG